VGREDCKASVARNVSERPGYGKLSHLVARSKEIKHWGSRNMETDCWFTKEEGHNRRQRHVIKDLYRFFWTSRDNIGRKGSTIIAK